MAIEKLKINCKAQKYTLDESPNEKQYKQPCTQDCSDHTNNTTQKACI